MLIKEIKAEETWELRQKVMWPTQSLDYVKVDEDSVGQHFGLFKENRLVSVISLFITGNQAQFRKFATDQNEQGRGYGTELLQFVFDTLAEKGIDYVWCNARAEKTTFYQRFGMKETSQQFHKGGIDYVMMEKGQADASSIIHGA